MDNECFQLRRSIFGYFCRRCYVSFVKLSFPALGKLCNDYKSWCSRNLSAGYEIFQKDELTCTYLSSNSEVLSPCKKSYFTPGDLLLYKTQADNRNWAKPHTFEAFVSFVQKIICIFHPESFLDGKKAFLLGMRTSLSRICGGFLTSTFMRATTRMSCPLSIAAGIVNIFFWSGLRPQALLSLVRMHYIQGEYAAAAQVVILSGQHTQLLNFCP